MVDPVQNLGDSFSCSIEKVFLCTGADGYVPKYNPTNKEYGCLADAPSLLYRLKILVSDFFTFHTNIHCEFESYLYVDLPLLIVNENAYTIL